MLNHSLGFSKALLCERQVHNKALLHVYHWFSASSNLHLHKFDNQRKQTPFGAKLPQEATSSECDLTSWSTASFPTRASPTNRTRSGMFTAISLASAVIKGALSCIRPAVSTSTTSNAWLRARREEREEAYHPSGPSKSWKHSCIYPASTSRRPHSTYRKLSPPWQSRQHPSHSPSHRGGP